MKLIKRFFLSRQTVGNTTVLKMPVLPKSVAGFLGWDESTPLRMEQSDKGVLITKDGASASDYLYINAEE